MQPGRRPYSPRRSRRSILGAPSGKVAAHLGAKRTTSADAANCGATDCGDPDTPPRGLADVPDPVSHCLSERPTDRPDADTAPPGHRPVDAKSGVDSSCSSTRDTLSTVTVGASTAAQGAPSPRRSRHGPQYVRTTATRPAALSVFSFSQSFELAELPIGDSPIKDRHFKDSPKKRRAPAGVEMKSQLRSVVHSRKPGIQFRSQARRSVERDDVTARSVGGDNLEPARQSTSS
jgi:hypothetical protein